MTQTVYHGSRNGQALSLECRESIFGGGLWCAKDPELARYYTPRGTGWQHVYSVSIPATARIFRPDNESHVKALAAWLCNRYGWDGTADELAVEDLQSNSPYDRSETQEGLEDLGFDAVETIGEILILDPSAIGATTTPYAR